MKPQEAIVLRRSLKAQIRRAHKLTERLTEQAADKTLEPVDRETSAHRAKLSIQTGHQLEDQLRRVQRALNG